MIFDFGRVDVVNWKERFAFLPTTFILDSGGFVEVWLESYQTRDIDCATAEVKLKDGRAAKQYTDH